MSKQTVNTKTADGKDITLIVRSPNASDLQKSQMESNKVFKMAVDGGSMLRSELNEYLKKRGLWNDEMEKQVTVIAEELFKLQKQLMKGGIKRSEAKKLCMKMRDLRIEQASLLYNTRQHDIYTAEAQAENAKFDYLVSVSVFDEEGNRYYKDIDDYKTHASEPAAVAVATALAEIVNNYDPDWEKKLPENEFLIKHGFVDDKLNFINKEKKLVDSEGRLINEDGHYINEAGELINRDGEKVDGNGLPIVEFVPLIDDEEEVKTEAAPKEEVAV